MKTFVGEKSESTAGASMPLLSVVVPCFNEADVLPQTHSRLLQVLESSDDPFEVVYVDDGSTDATGEHLAEFSRNDDRIRVLTLSRNFGHQAALSAGFDHAAGEVVAVIDADLQDPPELIPEMLRRWREGNDVVYGVRTRRKEGPLKRLLYYGYYRVLAVFSEVRVPLDAGDFALMDRHVVDQMRSIPERRPFLRGQRAWVGGRQVALAYERSERAAGQPGYTLSRLIRLAIDGILNCSTRPLRLVLYLGLLLTTAGMLGTGLVVAEGLGAGLLGAMGVEQVPAGSAIITAMMFLSGVQLTCLGVVGEYIGMIHRNQSGLPKYVVQSDRQTGKARLTERRAA